MHASIFYDNVESCQNAIRQLHESRVFGNGALDIQFWISKVDLEAEREQQAHEELMKQINQFRNQLFGGGKKKKNKKPKKAAPQTQPINAGDGQTVSDTQGKDQGN